MCDAQLRHTFLFCSVAVYWSEPKVTHLPDPFDPWPRNEDIGLDPLHCDDIPSAL